LATNAVTFFNVPYRRLSALRNVSGYTLSLSKRDACKFPVVCFALATLTPVAFLEEKFGPWKLVSRHVGIAWLCFYALFLLYAFTNRSSFLILDYANLIIHEGGHFFFSWFGNTIMILGGTLGELLVPLLCAIYFFFQRETTGFTFSVFWFFENFPYIGTYIADARTAALPLVGSEESDWTLLFTQWGLLAQDQKIGGVVRTLGYLGMLATTAWLVLRLRRNLAYK
jgi:hypothetical protein